jgi:hypothetical protein
MIPRSGRLREDGNLLVLGLIVGAMTVLTLLLSICLGTAAARADRAEEVSLGSAGTGDAAPASQPQAEVSGAHPEPGPAGQNTSRRSQAPAVR